MIQRNSVFKADGLGKFHDAWVPTRDSYNSWMKSGRITFHNVDAESDNCILHEEVGAWGNKKPGWGLDHRAGHVKGQVFCCDLDRTKDVCSIEKTDSYDYACVSNACLKHLQENNLPHPSINNPNSNGKKFSGKVNRLTSKKVLRDQGSDASGCWSNLKFNMCPENNLRCAFGFRGHWKPKRWNIGDIITFDN